MQVKVYREKTWYSAAIKDLRITTQAETMDELIRNLGGSLELYHSF